MLAAFATHAAAIYKWTDSDGVVHFSDQPVPGAEKVYTGSTNTSTAGPTDGSANTQPSDTGKRADELQYSEFSITSPTPEQTFFNDDVISANLSLNPDLKPGQTITWQLNGAEIAEASTATSMTLPHLDRGTYSLSATVTVSGTGQSRSSASVTFYVKQPSELAPQRQKP